ncbi:MAG: type II toxin-antitoxin system HipA family toxin [Burkholderiales bacterium]
MVTTELNVWMNGELVGVWSRTRTSGHRVTYEESWLNSPRRRSLSLSLPIGPSREITGAPVSNYFENLLPDNDNIRRRLSARFRTRGTEAFELLTAIGRDCVGAVQLLPSGMTPEGFDRIDGHAVNDAEVERLLRGVTADPLLGTNEDSDAFRISIAGAQEKTALLRQRGKWFRPRGATPTTHILKLPLGVVGGGLRLDMSESVENEWLCAQILRELGFSVAITEIAIFGDQKVLVVERFDRQWMDERWIARLPQEDFCQALGVPPDRKYESDGGPGIADALKLLSGSASPNADREQFLLVQLAFWLLAATDGHAKNFSVFLNAGDSYRLTPLYDVLSAWPVIGHGTNSLSPQKARLAMGIRAKNMHYRLREIRARHYREMAEKSGVPTVWEKMLELIDKIPPSLAAVEKRLAPNFPRTLWERISNGTLSQAGAFKNETHGGGLV